jgi:hypothetical protein
MKFGTLTRQKRASGAADSTSGQGLARWEAMAVEQQSLASSTTSSASRSVGRGGRGVQRRWLTDQADPNIKICRATAQLNALVATFPFLNPLICSDDDASSEWSDLSH